VSRDLNDDFEDDQAPGGPIDLEKGSQVGSGAASGYDDGGSIDFDDDLYGDDDGHKGGALELDLPGPAPHDPSHGPAHGSGPHLPDLAPSSRRLPAAPAAPAAPVAPTAPASHPGVDGAAPPSSSGRGMTTSLGPGSSGQLPAAPGSDPRVAAEGSGPALPAVPSKPSSASLIAKYPESPEKIWQAPMYAIRVVMRQFELRSDLESLRRRRSPDVPLYEAALRAYDPKTFKLGLVINCAAFTILTLLFFSPVFIRFLRAD
jgi:hypothetical protein